MFIFFNRLSLCYNKTSSKKGFSLELIYNVLRLERQNFGLLFGLNKAAVSNHVNLKDY